MRKLLKDESGAAAVLSVLMLVVLLGFSAFAVDMGLLYVQESKLQTACDAAAMGAASYLPDTCKAETEAKEILQANGYDITDCNIVFSSSGANGSAIDTIEVKKKVQVNTVFASIFDIKNMKPTKSAKASAGPKKKPFVPDYALFAETGELAIHGSVMVDGDAHTNDTLAAWGGSDMHITGTMECTKYESRDGNVNNKVTVDDGGLKTGDDWEHVAIPDYDESIMDMVPTGGWEEYNSLAEYISKYPDRRSASGQIVISGNVLFNDFNTSTYGPVLITGHVKSKGSITIATNLEILGGGMYAETGSVNFNNSISVNLSGYVIAETGIELPRSITDSTGQNMSVLYARTGHINMTEGGSYFISGLVYAPKSIINGSRGSFYIRGSVIGHQINITEDMAFSVYKPTNKEYEMEMDADGTGGSAKIKLVE